MRQRAVICQNHQSDGVAVKSATREKPYAAESFGKKFGDDGKFAVLGRTDVVRGLVQHNIGETAVGHPFAHINDRVGFFADMGIGALARRSVDKDLSFACRDGDLATRGNAAFRYELIKTQKRRPPCMKIQFILPRTRVKVNIFSSIFRQVLDIARSADYNTRV